MTSEEARELAGEYVLGTLSAPERLEFEEAAARDPALRALVREWEVRLMPLADRVPPVQPDARVWRAISAAAGLDGPAQEAVVIALRGAVRFWRTAAVGMGALAAALLAGFLIERFVSTQPAGERFVAAVNRGGDQPALIITVDLGTQTVLVRPVALETPAGKSLELWSVTEGKPPASLGVIGEAGARLPDSKVLQGSRPESLTFAVSVEPQGGSPTGAPTGPVVYSGKLVKE
jgi:anti-sigma-K factor RskA